MTFVDVAAGVLLFALIFTYLYMRDDRDTWERTAKSKGELLQEETERRKKVERKLAKLKAELKRADAAEPTQGDT